MGRRALRKIDPALDLSRHFKLLDELPAPLNTDQLFERSAPLEIEVGSGKGLFLLNASAAVPQHNFAGVEISGRYARFAAARLAKAQRANAVIIHGDAQRLFGVHLNEACAAAVHIYFPDPWWKKRHKKRRIMNAEFLRFVQRALRPAGALHFWTDVEDYFNESLALIATETSLTGPIEVPPSDPQHDLDYRTHFERRMRKHDISVFRAEFRKE